MSNVGGLEVGPDPVGDAPFQDADGFLFGFASFEELFVEAASFGAGAGDLGYGGVVERPVEAAVPASVEPVPHDPS